MKVKPFSKTQENIEPKDIATMYDAFIEPYFPIDSFSLDDLRWMNETFEKGERERLG